SLSGNTGLNRPLMRIDPSGNQIDYFQRTLTFYAPSWTNPATATPTATTLGWGAQDPRYLSADRMWTSSAPPGAPTYNGFNQNNCSWKGVTDSSIYNWKKYNTLHQNFGKLHASNYNLELEQQILSNLFFTAGWLRQD